VDDEDGGRACGPKEVPKVQQPVLGSASAGAGGMSKAKLNRYLAAQAERERISREDEKSEDEFTRGLAEITRKNLTPSEKLLSTVNLAVELYIKSGGGK
jgi:hypothetical protein